MNFDVNTLTALMGLLNKNPPAGQTPPNSVQTDAGAKNGVGQLSAMLPLVLGMMGGKSSPSALTGLLGMLNQGGGKLPNPFSAAPPNAADQAVEQPPASKQNSAAACSANRYARRKPFEEIAFAGSEVVYLMQKLKSKT